MTERHVAKLGDTQIGESPCNMRGGENSRILHPMSSHIFLNPILSSSKIPFPLILYSLCEIHFLLKVAYIGLKRNRLTMTEL